MAAVVLTSLGLITMPITLGCVVVAHVLTRVLSVTEVYSHVDWSIVVLLASMIPLGLALDSTGGTALIAGFIVTITQGAPAWVALLVLMAVTMFLSDVLNNNATTIIAAPVGIRLAEQLEVNPDAFLMGVAVAAACAFLTPIGHQNNTLVLGPGGVYVRRLLADGAAAGGHRAGRVGADAARRVAAVTGDLGCGDDRRPVVEFGV